jgi:hypothetical protein
LQAQDAPKALLCQFPQGVLSNFEKIWSSKSLSENFQLIIAAIDRAGGKAQLIGNAGAADLIVVDGGTVLNFLEITPTGNSTLTSVFLKRTPDDKFPAVHARHMSMIGNAVVSNYRGLCTARD